MAQNTMRFLALLCTALALAPAMAHLTENWEHLRMQWEYSHAGSALLNLSALIALILSTLVQDA